MKTHITFGQTLCAYVTEEVEIPDGASQDEVIAAIRKFYNEKEELLFDEDWSTSYDHRMVIADDPPPLSR